MLTYTLFLPSPYAFHFRFWVAYATATGAAVHYTCSLIADRVGNPKQTRGRGLVRVVGPSQIRHPPRLVILRRPRPHLPRDPFSTTQRPGPMDAGVHVDHPHRERQHGLLGAAGAGLPPRVRQLRRQRQRARVPRQPVGARHVPRARHGRQRRELVARRRARRGHAQGRRRALVGAGAALRHGRERQRRQGVGVQRAEPELRKHRGPARRPRRLGEGRLVEPHAAEQDLHREREPGQDGQDLDVGEPRGRHLVGPGQDARVRRRAVAGQLVAERERAGRERRRQQGHAVEGGPEGELGHGQRGHRVVVVGIHRVQPRVSKFSSLATTSAQAGDA